MQERLRPENPGKSKVHTWEIEGYWLGRRDAMRTDRRLREDVVYHPDQAHDGADGGYNPDDPTVDGSAQTDFDCFRFGAQLLQLSLVVAAQRLDLFGQVKLDRLGFAFHLLAFPK